MDRVTCINVSFYINRCVMRVGNKLSDLLFTAPQERRIKDYAKVNEIFKSYVNERYFAMSKEIFWYKEFDFFLDFCGFLSMNFKSELMRSFLYRDVLEMYEDNWAEVVINNSIKKQRKKWFK